MLITRRTFVSGTAAMAPFVVYPELAHALAASRAVAAWPLALQDLETDIAPTPMTRVHGSAPAALRGTLYRNGPAKFHRPGGSATHWFDGDGLVRAFRIDAGRATLTARFVDTPKRRADTQANAVVSGGFGTIAAPDVEIASADAVNAANTSVIMRGGELWALWEAGSPTVLDPESLGTRGVKTMRADLEHMPFLAHPKIERGGRLWNLGLAGSQAVVWQLSAAGSLEAATPLELPRASYIHDFTATDEQLIILLQPWVDGGDKDAPQLERLKWQPQLGTQILVLDKSDLSRRRVYELPSFFFFHVGGAWQEPDGTVKFEVCRYPNPDFATRGARDLIEGIARDSVAPTLAMITLDARGGARLDDTGVAAEFPRSDARRAGLARTQTLHVTHQQAHGPLFRGIALYDWQRGTSRSFDFGPDHLVEEMVFVAKGGDAREMNGWIVGPSVNLREGASELHVFEASHLEQGPICTWRANCVLPLSFHGVFVA